MMNAINSNYFLQYQNTAQLNQRSTATKTDAEKNPFANFSESTTVEISQAGLDALSEAKTSAADNQSDESKLSDKAKSYLENLRKKYGDYDFVVSNNLDAAQTVGSSKEYSVVFTADELEKMAEDDEYAEKVMGQVGSAVDMLKNLSEKDLGEGVQFSQLSVSFDGDGNMKLFAQLEKLSADQKERLEAAKEKRAEETKADEKTQADNEESNDLTKILFKSADVEASTEEELLNKIFGIDWSKIPDEEAYI